MALSHIISHHIQRQDAKTAATVNLCDSCWENNGRIDECFRELKLSVIKRIRKDYGRFSEDYGKHPLSGWLKEYTEKKLSFDSLSKKAMQHLKTELDNTEEVVDGFLFFAFENLEHDEIMHLFFVQHNTGQFIDGDLNINESFYLDTSHVCLSAKINLTDWLSGDSHRSSNALTLLRWQGQKELTEVFVNFIGFAEKIDISADTEAFLNTVSDFTKDLPEDTAHQTKKKIVDYCLEQDKVGKPVVIKELSTELNNNPIPSNDNNDDEAPTKLPDFAAFVSENKPTAKPELNPEKSQLRQFVRISGRDHKLSMSFSSSCLGDTIVYDPNSDSLTIHNIPPALKARLAKHFQESG